MYARRTRFLILGAVITVGLLGVILLQAPEPTRAVDDLMDDPDAFVAVSYTHLTLPTKA